MSTNTQLSKLFHELGDLSSVFTGSGNDVKMRNSILDEISQIIGNESRLGAVKPDVGGSFTRNVGPFRNFAEQMQAVIAAGTPGKDVDRRLFEVRAASGLGENIPSDGGQ
jgi:hypothetical protein